jgi:hypothetical protein
MMRTLRTLLSGCLLIAASSGWLNAQVPGHIDDFSAGTSGWQGSLPTVVANGGPAGNGDAWLRVEGKGGGGPGSRLATFNEAAAWKGDYASAGITSIDMDVRNEQSAVGALAMRLVLFGPNTKNERFTSVDAVSVPLDSQWHRVSFPVDGASLSRVGGSRTYEQMIENVVRVMVRHDTSTPSSGGTPVSAVLGIDNVMLIGPGGRSDFNFDGMVDVQDIDLLLGEVAAQSKSLRFDRSGDDVVNQDDILYVVTRADELNSYIGDANLDGEFSSADLVLVLAGGQYEDDVPLNSTWETGDWNGDREANTGDLVFALQEGGYELGPRGGPVAAVVPEPASCALILLGSLLLLAARREKK